MPDATLPIFYVYEHWRPDLDVPFYVGHGTKHRVYVISGRRMPLYQAVIDELKQLDLQPHIRIISQHPTKEDACDAETALIRSWLAKGIILANKRSEHDKVRIPSASGRERNAKAHSGRKATPEANAKRSATLTGRKKSPEAVRRIGLGHRGHPVSEETRAKLRMDLNGQRFGEWIVLRMSAEQHVKTGTYWVCQCSCGTIKEMNTATLRSGETQRCQFCRRYGPLPRN